MEEKKKKFVRVYAPQPLPWWGMLGLWLITIVFGITTLALAVLLKQHVIACNLDNVFMVALTGGTSLFTAIYLCTEYREWRDKYREWSRDSKNARVAFWLMASAMFYGLVCWFGFDSWTGRIILFCLGMSSSILIAFFSLRSAGHHARTNIVVWAIWLVPFFLTRQHWWKYVGYGWKYVGYGVVGLAGLAVLVAIGYALGTYFPFRAWGRFIGRVLRACIVKPLRFAYTVLVGYPRYWYMPEQQEHYAERKPLEMADSMEDVEQDASKPWYIYLPYGGLFRRCRIVWGRGRSCWKVERSRLGLGGYHLVDRQGARLRIEDVNSCLKAGDGPKDILRKRGIAVTSVEFTSPTGISYGQRQFLIEVLDKCTVQNVLESQLSHLKYEECQKRELQNRIEWSNKGSEEQKAKEAESRLEIAKQLAGIAALVKAAPRNKKLGAARHQLTQIVVGLANSEEKAKALLLDALEALEQSESQSN